MTKPPPPVRPTEAEMAILDVLWQRGPSTVRDVHAALAARNTGYTTVLKLMQIMADKGLCARDESQKSHVYRPLVDAGRTRRRLVADFIDRVFAGSAAQLVESALSTKPASRAELDAIRRLLDAKDAGPTRAPPTPRGRGRCRRSRTRALPGAAEDTMSALLALRALAATLAHFGWQGAVLALLLGAALRALRGTSPEARYAAAGAVLAAMAAAPVVTFVVVSRGLMTAAAPLAMAAPTVARAATADPISTAVAAVWSSGVLAMSVRLIGGALRVRGMVRRGTDLPAPFRAVASQLALRLGVGRAVRVLSSFDVDVPIALGWLRPAVLVPAALVLDLPTTAVEALLAHELAHVRRHDWALNLVQCLVEALLFYHPAVWWVSSRIRAEREHCCDDAVVALTGDALGYARALVSLETTRTETVALGVAANGGSLMVRIERMINGSPALRSRLAPRVGLGHALAVAAALLAGVTAPIVSCASAPEAADPAVAWLPSAVTRWTPSFVAAGQRHGVDPDLLAIVTLVESGGDPDVTSPVGAVGLMQLMPATAQHIAAERNLDAVSPAALRDPDVNIDLGASYLAAHLHEFGTGQDPARAVELAAAAYNGGESAVRAYLADGKPLSDETMAYKDRVAALWRQHHAEGR